MSGSEDVETIMPGVTLARGDDSLGKGEPPEFRQWVKFQWAGRASESSTVFVSSREAWAKIGDGDVCPGLELALRSLKAGVSAVVHCEARFAFGSLGRPAVAPGDGDVPPETAVSFEIKVLELGSADPVGAMGIKERVVEAERKRQIGNDHFKYKDYHKAAQAYGASLKAVDGALSEAEPGDEQAAILKLMIDGGNNLAAVFIKQGEHAKAEGACIAVLEADPDNLKALYRAGVAAMHQTKYEESRLAFSRLLCLDPENREGGRQYREMRAREKQYHDKEKRMAARMSQLVVGKDSTTTQEGTAPSDRAQEEVPSASASTTDLEDSGTVKAGDRGVCLDGPLLDGGQGGRGSFCVAAGAAALLAVAVVFAMT